MKKRNQIILLVLIGMLFINLNVNSIFASDDDDDGVDDDFEELNKRNIEIEIWCGC